MGRVEDAITENRDILENNTTRLVNVECQIWSYQQVAVEAISLVDMCNNLLQDRIDEWGDASRGYQFLGNYGRCINNMQHSSHPNVQYSSKLKDGHSNKDVDNFLYTIEQYLLFVQIKDE